MNDPHGNCSSLSTPHSISSTLFKEDDIVLVISSIQSSADMIYQEELEYVKNAATKRINEFSTGRLCARNALEILGINYFPVHAGNDREPVWPDKIVGSITHCKDLVGVAVAKNDKYHSIGLDIERIKKHRYDISRHICTKHEKEWISRHHADNHDLIVTLIFSIKESIYKACYQYKNIKLGFQDCSIKPDLSTNKAMVQFHNNYGLHKKCNAVTLRFYIDHEHIYSCAILKRNS